MLAPAPIFFACPPCTKRYEIKKDQISIDYENESVRDGTYTFTVEDNTLTLIGGEGTVGGTYTLTRVEEE